MKHSANAGNHGLSHLNDSAGSDTHEPWYRHGWVWFFIAILIWSMVSGISLVVIAYRNADDLVSDTWYQDGRATNRSIAEENLARALGIRARLTSANDRIMLQLEADVPVAPERLQLQMQHPTMASRDQLFELRHEGEGRYTAAGLLSAGRWKVTLTPDTGNWRIYQTHHVAPETPLMLGTAP